MPRHNKKYGGVSNPDCICNRCPQTFICISCKMLSHGRLRAECPVHPNTVFLMDFYGCPYCYKGTDKLLVVNMTYGQGINNNAVMLPTDGVLQAGCICQRSSETFVCVICKMFCFGRLRSVCLCHPDTTDPNDYGSCPFCGESTNYMFVVKMDNVGFLNGERK